jgi:hypothetical protein
VFLLPLENSFVAFPADEVLTIYDHLHGTSHSTGNKSDLEKQLANLYDLEPTVFNCVEWVLKNFLPPVDKYGQNSVRQPAMVTHPRIQLNSQEHEEFLKTKDLPDQLYMVKSHDALSSSEHRPNVTLSYATVTGSDNKPAVMIDIGSVGNIAGSRWIELVTKWASMHGYKSQKRRRERPLTVSGVGHGCQQVVMDFRLPCAFPTTSGTGPSGQASGKSAIHATLDMPSLPDSDTPGLMGLLAVRKYGGVIDTRNVKMYLNTQADADFNLLQLLPPGYKEIDCHFAASGHMMAHCCEYTASPDKDELAFAVKQIGEKKPAVSPPTEAPAEVADASDVPPPPSSSAL